MGPTTLKESFLREPIAEGKTKSIFEEISDPTMVYLISKDDITAGDGAKHDVIAGKAQLANQTACNVFRLLKACGIPVAFAKQIGELPDDIPERYGYGFRAPKCTMLPYEVVVRREAHGSYLKRAPHLEKGYIFPVLKFEFFLKTNGKKWKEWDLVCDDPYMVYDGDRKTIHLFDPKQPNLPQTPAHAFLMLCPNDVFTQPNEAELMEQMGIMARQTFLILEKAWQLQGRKLVDFKVEFGLDCDGKLLLADVIDNDSWRVVDGDGGYMDKQVYRDGGGLDEVTAKYRQVAELTGRFALPKQQVLLWRGSDKDDLTPFRDAVERSPNLRGLVSVEWVTCSAHKNPVNAYRLLQQRLSEIPDTVVIAYVGMSNGAGPILSANTTLPVITVPASCKEFPDDVWSSLRMPSNVPVMTVLNPSNAVLAALQILAMRNPSIYAVLRLEQEKRLDDM